MGKNKMKLVSFISIIILIIGVKGNLLISNKHSDIISIQLANIEALANTEASGTKLKCYKKIDGDPNKTQTHKTFCGTCTEQLCYEYTNEGQCTK